MGFKDFVKGIGTSISNAADKATDKVDNAIDLSKLKKQIAKKKGEINTVYCELGKKVVENGFVLSDEVSSAVEKINKLKDELKQLEDDRCQREGKCLCSSCGTELDAEVSFCSKCGTKIEHTQTEKAENGSN